MAKTRLRGLVIVTLMLAFVAAASFLFRWTRIAESLSARDEFGRNLYASTCDSVLTSYLEAGVNSLIAVAFPLLVAGFATGRKSTGLRWAAYGATRILDTVPLFFWLALIFSGIGLQGFWGRQLAIVLVAFPFTLGMVLDRFLEIAELPFVQNARESGMGVPARLWRLVIPNGLSSLYYPAVIIFGLSLTFDAVLGLMGMANRSNPSLGTLLWRAKERASIDTSLSILAIAAMLLTIAIFAGLRFALVAERRPSGWAGDAEARGAA